MYICVYAKQQQTYKWMKMHIYQRYTNIFIYECIHKWMNAYTYIPTREIADHLRLEPLSSAYMQIYVRSKCIYIPTRVISDHLHSEPLRSACCSFKSASPSTNTPPLLNVTPLSTDSMPCLRITGRYSQKSAIWLSCLVNVRVSCLLRITETNETLNRQHTRIISIYNDYIADCWGCCTIRSECEREDGGWRSVVDGL